MSRILGQEQLGPHPCVSGEGGPAEGRAAGHWRGRLSEVTGGDMHRRRSQGSGHPLPPARKVPKGKLGRVGRLARALACLRLPFVSTWPRPFHPMSTWPALHPLGLITNVTFSSVSADLQHGKGGSLPSLGPHCTPPSGVPVVRSRLFGSSFFVCLSLPLGRLGFGGTGPQPPQRKACFYEICFHTPCHTEPAQPRPQWPLWGGAADAPLTCPPCPERSE